MGELSAGMEWLRTGVAVLDVFVVLGFIFLFVVVFLFSSSYFINFNLMCLSSLLSLRKLAVYA